MKYRVIGWTEYDDNQIKTAPYSEGAENAIIDDIKTHGYLFSGFSHQEYQNCAPVLNDGKKRLFTQRNWGNLMAKAKGDFAPMDYANYAFRCRKKEKRPKLSVTADTLIIEQPNERFLLPVGQKQLLQAKNTKTLILENEPRFRYLDAGDELVLEVGEDRAVYTVKQAVWGWEYIENGTPSPLTLHQLLDIYHFHERKEMRKWAEEFYQTGKKIILVDLT